MMELSPVMPDKPAAHGGEWEWRAREIETQANSLRLQLAAVEDRLKISEVLKSQLQTDMQQARAEVERLRNLAANALQCVRAGQLAMADEWLREALPVQVRLITDLSEHKGS